MHPEAFQDETGSSLCIDVFSVGKTEASKFAGAIVQVFQEARGKLKGYKTGEKLSQPFKRICEKMLELALTNLLYKSSNLLEVCVIVFELGLKKGFPKSSDGIFILTRLKRGFCFGLYC